MRFSIKNYKKTYFVSATIKQTIHTLDKVNFFKKRFNILSYKVWKSGRMKVKQIRNDKLFLEK